MRETWVEVEGYPNYAVSDHGRVLNLERDRVLTPRPTGLGTLRVALSRMGVVTDHFIHHLVVQAFYGPLEPGSQVIHYDDDKTNNKPENLRIRKRSKRQPTMSMPEEPPFMPDRRWGTPVQIIETGAIFRTVRDCANYIGGDYATIYACLRGERQSHRGNTFRYYEE